jgi:arylsulfatase A-like enzyme
LRQTESKKGWRPVFGALLVLAALGTGLTGWLWWKQSARQSKPLAIVIVSIDTLHRGHLTVYGYDRDTSPEIERLARDAVVFENAIAVHTNTGPAHGSLMTGLYPPSHGIINNGHKLREGVTTLAQILSEQGVHTGAFISGWTLNRDAVALDRGFDYYDDSGQVDQRRKASKTLSRATHWMEQQAAQQATVFLFFHLFDPHSPYTPTEGFEGRFLPQGQEFRYPNLGAGPEGKRNRLRIAYGAGPRPGEIEEQIIRYDGAVAYDDHHVGQLLRTLEDLGYYDQALIVFLSDHGETLGERRYVMDHGSRVYEEQIRVPLIIRFPNNEFTGQRIPNQVGHVDLLPTLLDYLGLSIPQAVQGRSLMPLIRGEAGETSDPPAFSLAQPRAFRVPEIATKLDEEALITSIRAWPFKLIEYPASPAPVYQLFNLEKDPAEKQNLAAERPELVAALAAQIRQWRLETGALEAVAEPSLSPEAMKALRSLGYVE